jgi:hypothetical protein
MIAVLALAAVAPKAASSWWSTNWFNLTQTAGIIAGLLVAAAALRADLRARREELRARRAETLMQMTEYHREIWGRVLDDPSLERIFEPDADLDVEPITPKERMLCTFLILHLFASFEARKAGVFQTSWYEAHDIGQLFTRPVPAAAWDAVKAYQNSEFVAFVENARARFGWPPSAGTNGAGQPTTPSGHP